jgi:hypothetical protein
MVLAFAVPAAAADFTTADALQDIFSTRDKEK